MAEASPKNGESGAAILAAKIGGRYGVVGAVLAAVVATLLGVVLTHSSSSAGLVVGTVGLTSQTSSFQSQCPLTLTLDGTIDVSGGKGTVTYRFLHADGFSGTIVPGDKQNIEADGAATLHVTDQWVPNIPEGQVSRVTTLEVLTPNDVKSDSVTIEGDCDPNDPPNPPTTPGTEPSPP